MLALAVLAAVAAGRTWAGRAAALLLGLMWLWTGIAYHALFFAPINPAAYAFGAAFALQGLLYVWLGAAGRGLGEASRRDWRGIAGLAMIAYAMLVYPLLGIALGHTWPHAPMFGVVPCPTVIFTFGLMTLMAPPPPLWTLAIPVAWSLIGCTAAVLFGVWEDLGLLASAVLALAAGASDRRGKEAHD